MLRLEHLFDRLGQILEEHGLGNAGRVDTLAELEKLDAAKVGLTVLPNGVLLRDAVKRTGRRGEMIIAPDPRKATASQI